MNHILTAAALSLGLTTPVAALNQQQFDHCKEVGAFGETVMTWRQMGFPLQDVLDTDVWAANDANPNPIWETIARRAFREPVADDRADREWYPAHFGWRSFQRCIEQFVE